MSNPQKHSFVLSNKSTENLKKSGNKIKPSTSSSIPPNLEYIMHPNANLNNPFFTGAKEFSISKGTSMASSLRSNKRNGSKPTKRVNYSRKVNYNNGSINLTNFSELKRRVRRSTK
jgi:hypothetical protein